MLFRVVALVKKISTVLSIFLAFSGIILFTAQSYSTEESTQISLQNNPRMLAINTVTNRAVVTHWFTNAVSIVDLNFGSIIAQLPVGRLPKSAAIDTQLNMAVITYQGERTISLIDLNKNQIAADIYIGNYTGHVAVDSQTHTAVVASMIDLHVYFVDLVQRKVVAKTLAGFGMADVAVDPSQHAAYVVNPLAKSLKIFDMNTYRLSDTITLEKFPKAIDVNPEEQTVLITNYLDQTLTKIDLLTRRSFVLPANRYPLDVAYNTIDNRAVVLCDLDRKLLLLDLNTYETLNTYLLPRHPQSVAVNSLRNIAVVAGDETDGLTIIPLPLSPSLPKISITSPLDNAQITSETVNVSGTVENSSNVTVNGMAASVNGKAFSATLTLKAGQNTIAAIATDKYGRTACHSILVDIVLPVKGKITGTVTNAATGLLLPLALVTITDAAGNTQTIATIISGTYTAEVAPGAFTGTVIKPWYLPYSFAGTVAVGETATINALLTPADPVISNISVSEITSNAAKISWTTDQPAQGVAQYGVTTAYGNTAADSNEQTFHSLTLTNLSPSTTYHFRIAATSGSGVTVYSADNTFKTPGQIELSIASPTNGATINGNSVTVTGSVSNAANVETGITVNGMAAAFYNNQFTVNNIPLTSGQNTITVTATDIKGATASKSVTVNAVIPNNYIKLSAYPESGVAPMEVSLRINGTFSISNPTITFTGPGAVEQVVTDNPEEYKYRIVTEGIYNFTAQVTGPDGNVYADTFTVNVSGYSQVDSMLKEKWASMYSALSSGDVETAVSYFAEGSQDRYRSIFNDLVGKGKVSAIFANISDIRLTDLNEYYASCGALRIEKGGTYSYPVSFVKDGNGIWKIRGF